MTHEQVKQILTSDEEYYKGLGKQFLSNSDIGILLSNPKMYGKDREDNKSYAEGRYFHKLLIEPDKVKDTPFVDVSTRNTKEYKEFCKNNNTEFVMLKKEMEEVEQLVKIMRGNIQFFDDIYRPGALYEQPEVGEIKGMQWKGKADIVLDDMIIDLKTTSDIHKFRYMAKAYNYDSQCYLYQTLFGRPLAFYVIDKGTGQLGIFHPTQSFVDAGERKVERAVDMWQRYFGPNKIDDVENYYISDTLE